MTVTKKIPSSSARIGGGTVIFIIFGFILMFFGVILNIQEQQLGEYTNTFTLSDPALDLVLMGLIFIFLGFVMAVLASTKSTGLESKFDSVIVYPRFSSLCSKCNRKLRQDAWECKQCHKVFCTSCAYGHKCSVQTEKETGASMELEELKKLKELLDIGAITQQEYEDKKKKILENI
jgi:uncharacterized membrane protein